MNGFHDWSESLRAAPRWAWRGDAPPPPAAAAEEKEDTLGKVLPVEFTGQRQVIDPTIGDPRRVTTNVPIGSPRAVFRLVDGRAKFFLTQSTVPVTQSTRFGEPV